MRRKQSKILRIITLPFRALGKARDVYVRGLTRCTTRRVSYANDHLPRSYSAAAASSRPSKNDQNPYSEDFRELLRAASAKSLGVDLVRQQSPATAHRGPKKLPKSCSVGMGRIDEEESCDFGDDEQVIKTSTDQMFYRRSRSCAVRA